MAHKNLKSRVILPEDQHRIVQFYLDNFYCYEPVFSSEPRMVPGPRDLADIGTCIRGGTSIMCYVDNNGGGEDEEEIVGAFLCTTKTRSYVTGLFEAAAAEGNTKYGHYLRLLGTLHREAAICQRYSVDEIFFTFMAAVAPKWRNKNVLKLLGDETINLATKLGYKVYTADCTSEFSARVAELLGMDRLIVLKYEDFCDANRRPYFVVPLPHLTAKTYALRLPYERRVFNGSKL
ncbi:uncharacterized protein LOC142239060 [Haematobia irritans]|uniref:uncharacterized protein LOC142239060 n=1 Tax=Haematobia irritans TaxID=7368 RepID=UPI003F500139